MPSYVVINDRILADTYKMEYTKTSWMVNFFISLLMFRSKGALSKQMKKIQGKIVNPAHLLLLKTTCLILKNK